MIDKDLCWVDKTLDPGTDYAHLLMHTLEDNIDSAQLFADPEEYCLCCDRPVLQCAEFIYEDYEDVNYRPYYTSLGIPEGTPLGYIAINKLSWDWFYEENFGTACHTCEYYRDSACIPLRNMIRYHNETKLVPHFNLTMCEQYKIDANAEDIMSDEDERNLLKENTKRSNLIVMNFSDFED